MFYIGIKEAVITVLLAMTPTVEAHGAIAAAVGLFKLHPVAAFFLASIGTVGISAPLLLFWERLAQFLMDRIYIVNRFLTWLFTYTRRRHGHHFEQFGESEEVAPSRTLWLKTLALYIFVAVPGPLTGIWAGTVAAFVFGIPFRYAFGALAFGAVTVAGIDAVAIGGLFHVLFD